VAVLLEPDRRSESYYHALGSQLGSKTRKQDFSWSRRSLCDFYAAALSARSSLPVSADKSFAVLEFFGQRGSLDACKNANAWNAL